VAIVVKRGDLPIQQLVLLRNYRLGCHRSWLGRKDQPSYRDCHVVELLAMTGGR